MKVGFIIDPIETLNPKKDTSLLLMAEAKKRNYEVFYFEQKDLTLKNNILFANDLNLFEFDMLFMRKDPPVDMEYIYTTHLLELAEKHGVKVLNKPQALRDVNEKLFITHFPQCCVPMLIARSQAEIKEFLSLHKDIILKPLDGMGGQGIFRLTEKDFNINAIVETMTDSFIMVQKYIPEIKQGDKRIVLINGKALPYAISRFPMEGETRANLAAGGIWKKAELTERDYWICEQIGPTLKQMGLFFVGIDVIGDYLTEINVTSPTGLPEINQAHHVNMAEILFNEIMR